MYGWFDMFTQTGQANLGRSVRNVPGEDLEEGSSRTRLLLTRRSFLIMTRIKTYQLCSN
jgi:hypothetical protein